MTTRAKLTLCGALATALVSLSFTPLLATSKWVPSAVLLVAVAAGAGAALRRLPTARALVVPLQLLIVVYGLLLVFVPSSMTFGVLPGGQALDALGALLANGGHDIRSYAVPAPSTPGLRLIVVGSITLIAVVVDALAATYRRAAAAGLPLLALYSVGTGLAGASSTSWLWFLLGGAGYLALLHTEGQDRLSRWGRVFHGANPSGPGTATHGGYRVGLIALAVALIVPFFMPSPGTGLMGGLVRNGGTGQGPGGALSSLSPLVALTAGVRSDSNQELFRYTTDSAAADRMYLRIGALDDFDGVEWRFGQQSLQPLPENLPRPMGLASDVRTVAVETRVAIGEQMSSEWLPMPYPAAAVTVPGHWRYDPATLAVVGDAGQRTNGLKYTVISNDVQPTQAQLQAAGNAPIDLTARYTKLPDNLPAVVRTTALGVTAGKASAYDKAKALQDWFAKGDFTYSTKVDAGTGTDAIVRFLHDRTGFCVHFAATMAAMARSLGIPARVAIGFIPGDAGSGGSYVVRARQYHAWPELYFPGAGWTRFEPTPAIGASIPDYAQDAAAPTPSSTAQQPSAAPSDAPSAAPSSSSSCAVAARRQGDCGPDNSAAAAHSEQPSWWERPSMLAGLGLGALIVAVLLAPMLWRLQLRRRRLGSGRHLPGAGPAELTDAQVLAAWQELIDSAWDLGIPPDEAQTPRRTVRRLAETAELDTESAAAAGRVALATEQVLYAREVRRPGPLGADVRTARHGLQARAGRLARIRALLLPASGARVWWRVADGVLAVRQAVRERMLRVTAAVRRALRR